MSSPSFPPFAGAVAEEPTMTNLARLISSRRPTVARDELGGSEDGGLAIIDTAGHNIHVTPSRVTAALRYLLARRHSLGGHQLPGRIALTSALHGEGVTYVTRSL